MPKVVTQIIKAFYPPALLYFFQYIVGGVFRVYIIWPAFDIPMHFLGGCAIALTAFFLLRIASEQGWMKIHSKLVQLIFIVSFVALFATLWEFYEFLTDRYLGTFNQPSIADTMGDMFLGLLGGFILSLIKFSASKPPPKN